MTSFHTLLFKMFPAPGQLPKLWLCACFLKHDMIQQLVKDLHPSNSRHISKLLFISKVLGNIVCKQLQHVPDNTQHYLIKFLYGFLGRHSAGTAFLKVHNRSDVGKCSVLLLQDLSSAFVLTTLFSS